MHDPHGGGRNLPTHHGDIDLPLLYAGQRVVGADQADLRPGGSLEPRHGALRPGVGQQPTEPEANACLPPHGGESAFQLGQDTLDVVEELLSGLGGLHVPRTAIQKCHSDSVFQLLDGAAQRGLGDAELGGRAGEGLESRHCLEHPEVTQLDAIARKAVHA